MAVGARTSDWEWQKLSRTRIALGKRNAEACCLCGQPIDYGLKGSHPDGPTCEHLVPVAHGGDLLPPLSDLGVAHRHCQSRQGAMIGNTRRAKGSGGSSGPRPYPRPIAGRTPLQSQKPSRSSRKPPGDAGVSPGERPTRRKSGGEGYGQTPSGRFDSWADVPWMRDLVDVPEDATWPTIMSAPHPRAVGSLGAEAETWLRQNVTERGRPLVLRWWQRLAMRRQLEVDAEGALVWGSVVESTPRRSGKSVRLRAMSLWRLHQAEHFGEEQLILLTGKDLPIVREIIRDAWPWAIDAGYPVRKANGQEEVEHPDGSRWIVRGKDSVYGYDVTMGAVDEAWYVDQQCVDDGLEPALLERVQPQLILTSTAHRNAKSLMRTRRLAALDEVAAPENALLLQWSAPEGADITDREAWRLASPHWTPARESLLATTLRRIVAGQAYPDPDEPDPVEAFRAQYLNTWPAPRRGVSLWLDREAVARCARDTVDLGPQRVGALATAVDGSQWSAAVSDGHRAALAVGVPLEGALAFLERYRPSEVCVYQAEAHQVPSTLASEVKVVTLGEDVAACASLAEGVRSGSLSWWSPGPDLSAQFANVVTAPTRGGPRIAATLSRGPVDAVVALSRAYWRAVMSAPEAPAVW